jgi:hypothetical protein
MVLDTTGKATMVSVSDDNARTITAGAQSLSGAGIILLYEGKLYVVPDKRTKKFAVAVAPLLRGLGRADGSANPDRKAL